MERRGGAWSDVERGGARWGDVERVELGQNSRAEELCENLFRKRMASRKEPKNALQRARERDAGFILLSFPYGFRRFELPKGPLGHQKLLYLWGNLAKLGAE